MKGKIRFILKEWAATPSTLVCLSLWMLFQMGYSWLGAKESIWISKSVMDRDSWQHNLLILGTIAVSMILCDSIAKFMQPRAMSKFFTNEYTKFVKKISSCEFEMYSKYSSSQITTTAEFINYMSGYGFIIARSIICIITIIIVMINIFEINAKLLIPVVGLYLLGSIGLRVIFKKYDKFDAEARSIWRKRNQKTDNLINGFQEVKSFNTAKRETKEIKKMNDDSLDIIYRKNRISSIMYAAINMVDQGGAILVILYMLFFDTGISSTDAMAIIMLTSRLIQPILNFLDIIDSISDGANNFHDYKAIMEWENKVNDLGEINLSEFTDKISINNVSFSYGDSKDILNGISMDIHKGEKIGICGQSGGGKSTIFKLLNRFYNPNKGSITIDGINIQDITYDSYRKHIGSVHQDNVLFPGSIKENLLYGCPNATESEMIEACKKANIYDFISGLENKFETDIGPKGLKLSGGERQRIAIARVLLTKPDILLLDEATSALDNKSERLIQSAIENLDCTVIMIAHRLSTIRNCDMIYVLGKDGIIEHGNHNDLVAKKGKYYSMLNE